MADQTSAATSTSREDPCTSVKLVVAVDFGTTYSGYAFSIGNRDKQIYMMKQPTGGAGDQKIPTCLLLQPDHRFHSFGRSAQDHYYNQLSEEEQSSWLYFERFKMTLHSSKVFTSCLHIAMTKLAVFELVLNLLVLLRHSTGRKNLKQQMAKGSLLSGCFLSLWSSSKTML